ncbi:MAG: hypothetical protein K0U39_07110 [Alphaproteobacteria bacterium]|nr:hypothetical protein [Alphaproteobacteria bacterium]
MIPRLKNILVRNIVSYHLLGLALIWCLPAYAVDLWGNWTAEYGLWEATGQNHFNFSRPELSPAQISRSNVDISLQEYYLRYHHPETNYNVNITYIVGESNYGVRRIFDYCDGAYNSADACATPPRLYWHREMPTYSTVSIAIIDYQQDLKQYTAQSAISDYFNPPFIDYNWLVGYVAWADKQWTRGNQYVYPTGAETTTIETITTGQLLAWSGGRVGVNARYLPQGENGALKIRGQIVYVLASVSGAGFDLFHVPALDAPPHINFSGTGEGMMLDVEFLYKVSGQLYLGINYRDWRMKARGSLQPGPNYVDNYELTNVETRYTGPRFFLEFSF